ncbi:metallophosphoesterase family protein [Vibrio crassostreae]|uniref:metallophosphoesterase family protein n=1 Tax=Vibrio crassostreae TaxID=246167 RepID=UPI001B314D53|nr:metallophosphoesterase family protein [Vibrio crassostreae]
MKIAVLSDVHSNSYALEKAIEAIELENVDEVVFLGDLLTYGCNVQDSIELLTAYSRKRKVHFIKGNHDQIYFDMQAGKDFQYKPFPDFILESALYTAKQLEHDLKNTFKWRESVVISNVFFSHANALGYGDWSYLNNVQDIMDTSKVIFKRGYLGGVFGHTHRPNLIFCRDGKDIKNIPIIGNKVVFSSIPGKCFIANPGSVGQPRGMEPSVLFIDINHFSLEFEVREISYDVNSHCENIESSMLSKPTKEKLLSYYKNLEQL